MSLISITNLTFGYDGSAENVFENVSLSLDTAWRLGLTGRNGRGKTTLLRLLEGGLEYRGNISAAVGFEYFPYPADENELVIDIIREKAPSAEDWEIPRELFDRSTDGYSAGQRKKVMLARSLSERAHLYIWDEPLNYIDVVSRMQIEQLLTSSDITMIFTEHDNEFTEKTATRRIELI